MKEIDQIELCERLDLRPLVFDGALEQLAKEVPDGLRAQDRALGQAHLLSQK
jgi:hypothetical protein